MNVHQYAARIWVLIGRPTQEGEQGVAVLNLAKVLHAAGHPLPALKD